MLRRNLRAVRARKSLHLGTAPKKVFHFAPEVCFSTTASSAIFSTNLVKIWISTTKVGEVSRVPESRCNVFSQFCLGVFFFPFSRWVAQAVNPQRSFRPVCVSLCVCVRLCGKSEFWVGVSSPCFSEIEISIKDVCIGFSLQ